MLKHKIKPYIAQNCEICLYAYVKWSLVPNLKKKHNLETIIITFDLLIILVLIWMRRLYVLMLHNAYLGKFVMCLCSELYGDLLVIYIGNDNNVFFSHCTIMRIYCWKVKRLNGFIASHLWFMLNCKRTMKNIIASNWKELVQTCSFCHITCDCENLYINANLIRWFWLIIFLTKLLFMIVRDQSYIIPHLYFTSKMFFFFVLYRC